MTLAKPGNLGFCPRRLERIRPALERHIADDKLPGTVTLLARDGKVVQHEAYGGLHRGHSEPMTTDAIFRLYSMTKPITCVALMVLYEQGHFQLTDPAAKFISKFDDLKVAVEADQELVLEDLASPVTIHQLLTHTSGLSYSFSEYGSVEEGYRTARVCADQPLGDFIAALLEQPLAFQPGTRWRYSFSNDVVARLVEVISGLRFDDYLREHIFEPLRMNDTDFFVPEEKHHRFTSMYGSGDILAPDVPVSRLLDDLGAGVNIQLAGPDDCLEASPLDEEGIPQPGVGYGLGFGVMMDVAQAGSIGSNGEYYWSGAASTSFWIDPVEMLVGIQLTQFQPSGAFTNAADFKVAAYQAMVD